ncbi:MAG: YfcE family phosphodiesterase [Candidatus Nezhaarchaeales archaeon]|nr:MAG: YfcE family phosphodiesterase [Candidatus Nezhaarchaeota archaeon WYZ-LMO8]TDA36551.1 MAG: YfcE family phosphodiesterase [Candidatus Nezhaarchaeota archaeon WYZ-LMO7]
MVKKVLALGDFHIPERAYWIPEELEKEVTRESYDIVLCTGDLTTGEVLSWLQRLASEVYVVRGNMDYLKLPLQLVVNVEGLRVGLYHGAGVHPRGDPVKLAVRAKQINVEVLVTGHTHYPYTTFVKEYGVVIVNPGSATGVWGGDERATLTPSFAIMCIRGRELLIELKELRNSHFEVEKYKFQL